MGLSDLFAARRGGPRYWRTNPVRTTGLGACTLARAACRSAGCLQHPTLLALPRSLRCSLYQYRTVERRNDTSQSLRGRAWAVPLRSDLLSSGGGARQRCETRSCTSSSPVLQALVHVAASITSAQSAGGTQSVCLARLGWLPAAIRARSGPVWRRATGSCFDGASATALRITPLAPRACSRGALPVGADGAWTPAHSERRSCCHQG